MGAMPIGESPSRRAFCWEKGKRSHGENLQKLKKCSSSEGETVILQAEACQEVDKSNALHRSDWQRFDAVLGTHKVPQYAAMRHADIINGEAQARSISSALLYLYTV
jgi:hypothetical protein